MIASIQLNSSMASRLQAFFHMASIGLYYYALSTITHSNLKAANICDRGLAVLTPLASTSVIAKASEMAIANTTVPVAPEHFKHGSGKPKADIYSFRVLLLELLTGRHRFDRLIYTCQLCVDQSLMEKLHYSESYPSFKRSLTTWALSSYDDEEPNDAETEPQERKEPAEQEHKQEARENADQNDQGSDQENDQESDHNDQDDDHNDPDKKGDKDPQQEDEGDEEKDDEEDEEITPPENEEMPTPTTNASLENQQMSPPGTTTNAQVEEQQIPHPGTTTNAQEEQQQIPPPGTTTNAPLEETITLEDQQMPTPGMTTNAQVEEGHWRWGSAEIVGALCFAIVIIGFSYFVVKRELVSRKK